MITKPFEKYQGLGNDFILFDQSLSIGIPEPDPETIRRICNRRFGVGADGILLFNTVSIDNDHDLGTSFSMIYFNSDGGRAETCFNGIRCIALHAALTDKIDRGEPFYVLTDAGPVEVKVDENKNEVEMNLIQEPLLDLLEVTLSFCNTEVHVPTEVDNFELTGTTLSIGNPHFVAWVDTDDLDSLNNEVLRMGPVVENSGIFPNGTNFELVCPLGDDKLLMAVWERGVGRTMACGSGATAAVYAGVSAGRLKNGEPVEVTMLGGKLVITIPEFNEQSGSQSIRIKGPAEHVFSGSFDSSLWKASL